MPNAFSRRRKFLQARMAERGVSSLLVTHPANWYYLTGFTGESGALVLTRSSATLITDGRFTVQARQETGGIRVLRQRGALTDAAGSFLATLSGAKVGYDASRLTVGQFKALQRSAGARKSWKDAAGLVEGLRLRKDAQELAQMRKAALLASQVVASTARLLKPGVTELEIAAEAEYQMRRLGASGPAFETIVAFGERGAFPHARPTAKKLRKNELVVLDLGAILGHYCSDITRTFFCGKAPARIRRWYRAVQEAQEASVASVRAGATCGEVDAAARRVLEGYRLGDYFVHSTGHGLGLEVHEDPRVAKGQTQRLESGNVITIEPGVYVEGVGGIRIEDDVAVQEQGSEVLTRFTRDLIEL
ncbi:MAG TPA: Xaa-Pro peptidase family protein [Candidatus Acidoferrales bacterium]|nr:Xaa-Pro peptidase family protein [Candidatus Acidoferrales bacterium]